MKIIFQNFTLDLDTCSQENMPITGSNPYETHTLKLIRQWCQGQKMYTFHTSGSTSLPRRTFISKKKILLSVYNTFSAIDPKKKIKTALLCLNPTFIGGAMVIFRALIQQLDLKVITPTIHPFEQLLPDEKFDLVSLIPLQFHYISQKDIKRFKNILIGGAPIDVVSSKGSSNIYATYGMTETVSHVALRKINQEIFQVIGDTRLKTNEEGVLALKGSITNHKWLLTSDFVKPIDCKRFIWQGRKDFIINTGGIKIHPEVVEKKLSCMITVPFIISSLPHAKLGSQVILIIEATKPLKLNFDILNKYERPKIIKYVTQLAYTSSGKIDRMKSQKMIEERSPAPSVN